MSEAPVVAESAIRLAFDSVLSDTLGAPGRPVIFDVCVWDPEVEPYQVWNRTYNPRTGRWLRTDPIGVWGDVAASGNGFTFAQDNSPSMSDPQGLIGSSASASVSVGAVGIVSLVAAIAAQSAQARQPACTDCREQFDPANPVYYDQNGCCVSVELRCRGGQDQGIANSAVTHCYLAAVHASGVTLGSITGLPGTDPGPAEGTTVYVPDGDLGGGGDRQSFIAAGDDCEWIKCAHDYAQQISGQFGYTAMWDNSNTFITRIIRHCGGQADFTWYAWGADDISWTDPPLPPSGPSLSSSGKIFVPR